MNLSHAIRTGIVGREVIESDLFAISGKTVVGCCTLGAAMVATLGETRCAQYQSTGCTDDATDVLRQVMRARYPTLTSISAGRSLATHLELANEGDPCPELTLESAIELANDTTPLRPEDIADALDELGIFH